MIAGSRFKALYDHGIKQAQLWPCQFERMIVCMTRCPMGWYLNRYANKKGSFLSCLFMSYCKVLLSYDTKFDSSADTFVDFYFSLVFTDSFHSVQRDVFTIYSDVEFFESCSQIGSSY